MSEAIAIDGFIGLVPRTRLRLTRRGRVVFTSIAALPLVVWALVAVLGAGGAAAGSGSASGSTPLHTVTVSAGDTLWELAERLAPAEDPRDVVAEIVRLNGLDGAVVQPGQQLWLPAAR